MKRKLNFHFYAIITIVCWSLAYVLSRVVMQEVSSETLGFLRYFIATIMLVCFLPFSKLRKVDFMDLGLIFLTGATGFFLYMLTFNKGVKEVNAATSSVIIATVPLISSLLSRIFYKEELSSKQKIAMGVSFVGVMIITILNKGFTVANGLKWLFAAALFLASYNLLQKKLVQKYSAFQSTMLSIFAGTIMLSVFIPKTINEVKELSFVGMVCILIMGIFSSAIAYVCWTKAFEMADNVASVSNYMYVTPLVTTILGFLIAKEFPDSPTILGGVIILAGLILFNSDQLFPIKPTIRNLDMKDLDLAAQVIRESFSSVAKEFNLTYNNCPTNGAFTKMDHLATDLEKGKLLFGVYVEKKMIGFFELAYTSGGKATLEKVSIIPAERGKKYGKFILNKAREIALNDNMHQIDIGIIKENKRLKKWYQKNGYHIVDSKKFLHLPFEVLYMILDLKK